MRDLVVIRSGHLCAEIVPSLGGGLARFDLIKEGLRLPVFRPWPDAGTDDPNQLACYVLVPWSNRISGGGFHFGGRFHPLAANFPGEPAPLHGNGWTSEWSVVERFPARARLELVSEGPGPFRYAATLSYALDSTSLSMQLAVTNQAIQPLPFGLGFHPWLVRAYDTRLLAPAATVWLEDARHLPTECVLVSMREDWDFSLWQTLPAEWINNGFGGWGGRARIEWPQRRLALDIEAGAALSTYLLYSPGAHADFFCFEPVSHPVDAHNLTGGPAANGLKVLAPGEAFKFYAASLPAGFRSSPVTV